jgi:hypothetical protein
MCFGVSRLGGLAQKIGLTWGGMGTFSLEIVRF